MCIQKKRGTTSHTKERTDLLRTSQSLVLGGNGLSVPCWVGERSFDHTHLLSLRAPESSVDNRSRDTVFRLALPLSGAPMNSPAVLSRFLPCVKPFACWPALFITFFLVNARGCHFLGSKPIDSSYLSARLFARLPLYPLAASFGLFCSERLFACVDSAPWRYLLIRLLAMFLLLFGAERLCSHFKKEK